MGYLTIDAGTTNMRVRYIEENEIRASIKVNAGVRLTAVDGNNHRLKVSLRDAITGTLVKADRSLNDVEGIIASGMITSNLGLIEIPHLTTPVGINGLATGMMVKCFPDIVDKEIHFIPGVKNGAGAEDDDVIGCMDMMRGEEAESLGAGILQGMKEDFVFISPGSHTKFVFVDEDQQIQSCCTTLTGELLAAISGHTILSDSLSSALIEAVDPCFIQKGIEAAKKYGLTKACFSVRVLDTLQDTTENERANFLAGALAFNDILALLNRTHVNVDVLIGGNPILQKLYEQVLLLLGWSEDKICVLDENSTEMASSVLGIKLFESLSSKS